MGSKNEMTRKEFLVLTFTLIGSTAAVSNCDDDSNNATGTAGSSGGGTTGTGGTSTGGTGGTGTGGTGTGGSGGTAGTGGGAAQPTASCADPLPETQATDTTGHTHTVTIAASALNATTAQMFTTSVALSHMHTVTLEPAQLAALKSGGSVTVMSSISDSHGHMYAISCR